jgi:hypothetical protein
MFVPIGPAINICRDGRVERGCVVHRLQVEETAVVGHVKSSGVRQVAPDAVRSVVIVNARATHAVVCRARISIIAVVVVVYAAIDDPVVVAAAAGAFAVVGRAAIAIGAIHRGRTTVGRYLRIRALLIPALIIGAGVAVIAILVHLATVRTRWILIAHAGHEIAVVGLTCPPQPDSSG